MSSKYDERVAGKIHLPIGVVKDFFPNRVAPEAFKWKSLQFAAR